tara:strand:- start:244586 stop:246226 length:1641 start_codon:yes stop_codon:yes gene_type:complete
MSNPNPPQITPRTPWWNALALNPYIPITIILTLLVLRLAWQFVSPFTLIEDEAHYWEWSRHLDWSYYSKGPGVSWIIWISTSLLGVSEFAVRTPAAIAAALGAFAVVKMAKVHFQDHRLVFLSAILYACVPGFAVAAMIMTIDSPYVASWAFASMFALRAILTENDRARKTSWLWFGLWIAIGFIFKYTILLLLPGVLLALYITRKNRPSFNPKHFALAMLIACIGLIPVGIWNANHDWATVRHLLGHLDMPGGDTQPTAAYHADPWTILWMLEYIALQLLVGGPVFILAIFALINSKKRADQHTQLVIRAMLAMGFPILLFYLLVSLVTQTEGNWAMAAFVTFIPPAAWAIIDGVQRKDHPIKFAWGAAITIGAGVLFMFPGAKWISKQPVVGDLIPLYRMTGMKEHAADTQRVIDQLQQSTGQPPLVMSEHYGRASLLAFYLDGHPTVYCTSAQVGGRKTQYDMWAHTDLTNPDTLAHMLGKPAVLFGGPPRNWSCAFDQLNDIGQLNAEPKEHNTTYTGLNFHTFDSWVPRNKANPQTDQTQP